MWTMLPDDLRLITLKYDSDCDACGTTLHAGEQAYWSPSARGQVWCQTCGPTPRAPATGMDDADPRKTRRHGLRRSNRRVAPDSHDAWSRLCRYLSKCVLAESANTLVMFQDLNKKGFLHEAGAEHLVSGDQDWTPVPKRLGRHLDAVDRTKRDAAFIYGWPVLVARNQKNYPVIAPLFLVSVRAEQRDSQWIGKAESEPEFNLSIVAGELFDMSAKEEIDALVGEGLPFGDAAALVHLARNIAGCLTSVSCPISIHNRSTASAMSRRACTTPPCGFWRTMAAARPNPSGTSSTNWRVDRTGRPPRRPVSCPIDRILRNAQVHPRRTRWPLRSRATDLRNQPSTGSGANR